MRVALVHPNFVSIGSERYIWSLAHRLKELDVTVDVFASRFQSGAEPSLRCHRIPCVRFPRSLRPYFFSLLSRRAIAEFSFDVVHGFGKTVSQNIYTEGSGLARAFENYQDFQGHRITRWGRRLSPVRMVNRELERRRYLDPSLRTVLFMSQSLLGQFHERFGLSRLKSAVVYSAVDCERFAPRMDRDIGEVRVALGISPAELVLLMVGNDFQRKNVDSVLWALAKLNSGRTHRYRLLVVGRSRPARWQKLAHQLGVASQVDFLGVQPEVERYYGAADMLLHPARFDAFGIVVLEAMAAGLPVVVSRVAGSHEIVDHGIEGLLLDDCESVDAITEAVHFLSDPSVRKKMGEAARSRARDFDWPHHVRRILGFYEEIAAR